MLRPINSIRLAAAYFAAATAGLGFRSIIAAISLDDVLVKSIAMLPQSRPIGTFSSYGPVASVGSVWTIALLATVSAGILFIVHRIAFVLAELLVGLFARPRLPDLRSLAGDPLPNLRLRAMVRSAWVGVYAFPLALVLLSIWQEVSEASIRVSPGLLPEFYITLVATFAIVPLVYLCHGIGAISEMLSKALADGPLFCSACCQCLIGVHAGRCPECGIPAANQREPFTLRYLGAWYTNVFCILIGGLALLPIWWPLLF